MHKYSACAIPVFLALVLFSYSHAFAYEASITASVSKAEVKKGETFVYTLKIIEEGSPEGQARLAPPDFTGFRVSASTSSSSVQVARDKSRKVTEIVHRLSSDLPGEHVIPSARLVLTDMRTGTVQEMTSNEVKVVVSEEEQGVIGGIAGEIRDIKEPKTLIDRIKLYFYGLVALAVIALLILVGFAAYVVGKKKGAPGKAAKRPEAGPGAREIALAEIEKASAMRDDPRACYTAVSDAVRRYMAASYGIAAMEATTAELVARARAASIHGSRVEELEGLFTDADLVKFAKHSPSGEETERFIERAASLVKGL